MKTIRAFAITLAIALTLALTSCDAGGGEVTCAVCDTSFTAADCMAIANAHGCSSGTTAPSTCPTAAIGCKLEGCPAGEIMCTTSPDGGL